MAYGIEVYRAPGYPTLVDTMLGGRVFIELLELSPNAGNPGNISVGSSSSLVYTNVPGGQYLKYYTLQGGPYSISTSTNGSGQAVLNFTRLTNRITLGGGNTTTIAVFATKLSDSSYGMLVTNSNGDRLVSTNYVTPVFVGRATFNSSPTYTYGLTRQHERTISYGSPNSYKLILYTIPNSTNVWFTAESFISSTSSSYTLTTKYMLPSASTTYQLAEAYVFQLNNISLSSHNYGIRIWNSSSPQKLTFDSGLEHINIAGIQESPKISFYDTEQSITNSSLYNNYSAIVIPEFYREIWQQSSPNPLSSTIKFYRGAFRRQSSTLYYKLIQTDTGFEDAVVNATYQWGSQYDNTIFIVDTTLLGGTGSGGTGSNSLSGTISEGSGIVVCGYDTAYSSSCTTTKTYNISTSGGDSTNINYNWSIIENAANFVLTTASNLSSATISHTGSAGTYAAVIRCTLTQSGVQTLVDYPIQHTHEIASATYTVSTNTTSVNEGQNITFTITTTGVPTNTTLYWTLNSISETDLVPTQTSGSFIIGSASNGSVTLSIYADQLTEGAETFTISIRTGSITGTIVATSPTITINDTSTADSGWQVGLTDTTNFVNGGSSKILRIEYVAEATLYTLPTFSVSSDNANLTLNPTSGTIDQGSTYESEPGTNYYVGPFYKDINLTAANISGGNQSVSITVRSPSGGTIRKTVTGIIKDVGLPTVTLTPSSGAIAIDSTTTVTVTTSEETTTLTSADISVNIGSISNFTGSSTSYSFTYTAPSTGGTATISIAAGAFQDIAGNSNTAGSTQITVVAPTLYAAPQITLLSASPGTGQDETTNRTVTFTFDVTDNSYSYNQRYDGTTFIGTNFYWAIEGGAGVTASDFDGLIYGTLQSINGTITRNFSITIKTDQITEGSEQYRVNFYRNGSYVGTPYYQSGFYTINDTSLTPVIPTYTVIPSSTSISEINALSFTINTTNVANGTTLYWTMDGTNINAIDFNQNTVPTLTTTVSGNAATGYASIVNKLGNKHWGQPPDQSTLDYFVSALVNEQTTTTAVELYFSSNTYKYYIDSGSITINSNSATVTGTVNPDFTTEGTETLIFNLRSGSTTGPVIATTSVTLYDLVATPTVPTINSFTASPNTITSGSSVTLSWSITGADVVKIIGIGAYNSSITSIVLVPTATTTYTLQAINVTGTSTSSITVTVTAGAPVLTSMALSPSTVAEGQTYTITVNQNNSSTSNNQITLTLDQKAPNYYFNTFYPPNHLITILAGSTSGSFSGTVGSAPLRHNIQLTASGSISSGFATAWGILGGDSTTGISYIDFNVINTAGATQNTANVSIYLRTGQTIQVGTTVLSGTYLTSGDSYIRLIDPSNITVAYNDDYGGGRASYFSYSVVTEGVHIIKVGGFLSESASGRAGYIFS
jgi:hypothetical protein